jgi:peptidoglycan/LPS O-acetylase OafA/YrhL
MARGLTVLRACVGLLIIASVLVSLPYIGSMEAGYYGSPQRAKELLAGALVAVAAFNLGRDLVMPTWVALFAGGFLAWTALAMSAMGPLTYAVPCAVIVAWAAGHPRALAWLPLVGTGRISYGLYLYHYPLIGLALSPLLLVGLTFAAASASWFLVERRFVSRRPSAPRPAHVALEPSVSQERVGVPAPA